MRLAMLTPTLLLLLVSAPAALAQQGSAVVVNGKALSPDDLRALRLRMGIPAEAPIPPGKYWYDAVSGLWGNQGGPAMGQLLPGLELGGPLRSDASGSTTGVFINGRQIHLQEVAYLQRIFGYVLPGRYWLNWQGIGGVEGGPPLFNVMAAAAQAGGSGQGYNRRTPFGSIGGDGNCSYYLHPNGSSVSNC